MVSFGRALGFEVVVVDARGGDEVSRRFPAAHRKLAAPGAAAAIALLGELAGENAAALVMNHHFDADRELVRELLGTPVGYLGLLGPQSRGRRLLAELEDENPALETGRVFSPVGLDLGADTPEKVALSILAEILAVFAGRQGGFLKDRVAPIHSV
jgi:xanthine/CO dehydrogenase XdhC/CoxF family maturation factor